MDIGIISDEIALNFSEAVRLGTGWGISLYELRCTESGRVPYITEGDVQGILRCKEQQNISITAITPGVFKIPLKDDVALKREIEKTLPDSFRMADRLGTNKVIVFGFQHYVGESESDFQRVVDVLGKVANIAQRSGFLIALENEPGFWADTGKNTSRILASVNSENLRANWDPGNAVGTGEVPYPDGYDAVKSYVCNVHAKDSPSNSLAECVLIGQGIVDWHGQLRALVRDRCVSHITIETHCLPLIEKSRKNLEIILDILKKTSDV
jgi:sugar phosphate isomerase/epimerase